MIFNKSLSTIKRLSFLLVLIITLHSCYNDPQFLGNNLIPEDDIYGVKTDTLFELSAYTLTQDSINTFLPTEGILGYVNSEIFGSTKGSFVGRYLPSKSTEGYGGPTAKPDSLFFFFTPNSFYGDSTIQLTIKIHELNDTSVLWEPYNGLKSMEGKYNPVPFLTATYKGGSQLKIPVDTSFARLLMDSTALADTKNFYTKFKGFYITCDDLPGFGGVAYNFSTVNAYLKLFYHYEKVIDGKDSTINTTKAYSFSGSRFLHYQHDHTRANSSKAIKYLNDTINQDTVFYTQGLGGVYGKIKLDGLTQWLDSMPVIIHRAELIIGRDNPTTITPDSVVNQLVFYYKIEDSWAGMIIDQQFRNSTKNNGSLRKYSDDYNVNITSQFQRILEQEIKDRSIYVFPSSNSTISRAVLQSGSSSRKLKLRLTYTKLK